MMEIIRPVNLNGVHHSISTRDGIKISIIPSIGFLSTESLSKLHLESVCLMNDWNRAADLINLDGINNRVSR